MKSSRLVLIVLSILLAITIISLAFSYFIESNDVEYNSSVLVENASQNSGADEIDSDKDGLADWEELIFGSDSNNPDTDNDGILDGEEVSLSAQKDTEGNNLTQQMSEELITRFMSLREIGGGLSQTDKVTILQNALSSYSYPKETYTDEDVNTKSIENEAEWRAYGNFIGLSLSKNLPHDKNPLEEFEKALADKGEMTVLKEVSGAYENIENDLLNTSIPNTFKDLHLETLNSANTLKGSLINMVNYENDPVLAIYSIQNYQNALDIFSKSLIEYKNTFDLLNVSFKENDGGYIFR